MTITWGLKRALQSIRLFADVVVDLKKKSELVSFKLNRKHVNK